ncbi:MAG: hypothetical protein HFE90_03805 [Firmicutes bacterium]|nr:hypothetical protein [Bacillota bacterium]
MKKLQTDINNRYHDLEYVIVSENIIKNSNNAKVIVSVKHCDFEKIIESAISASSDTISDNISKSEKADIYNVFAENMTSQIQSAKNNSSNTITFSLNKTKDSWEINDYSLNDDIINALTGNLSGDIFQDFMFDIDNDLIDAIISKLSAKLGDSYTIPEYAFINLSDIENINIEDYKIKIKEDDLNDLLESLKELENAFDYPDDSYDEYSKPDDYMYNDFDSHCALPGDFYDYDTYDTENYDDNSDNNYNEYQ